jgi:hypothetical protein
VNHEGTKSTKEDKYVLNMDEQDEEDKAGGIVGFHTALCCSIV